MLDLSIIIVTYNSEAHIFSCLEAIFNQKLRRSYEVIVVDNQSSDQTISIVTSFPSVRLIANQKNVGFSKANNIGVDATLGKFIMFLNPDVMVDQEGMDNLIDCLEKDLKIGVIAPKLLYDNGCVQESVRRYPNVAVQTIAKIPGIKRLFRTMHNDYVMKNRDVDLSQEVDWVIGAAMLCRKEILQRIGKFDEDFFLYCEDTDLCYRFTQHSYSIYYLASTSFIHQYQKASSRGISRLLFIHLLSIIRFYRKHPELAFRKGR